ncbi:hypothetical protein [Thiohalorhabdus sp.]|uniref:hypothetical protein n=1 Tax=Thiohalorhabdus sp. TaxID=3094134 RepID=UPI002FC2F7DC
MSLTTHNHRRPLTNRDVEQLSIGDDILIPSGLGGAFRVALKDTLKWDEHPEHDTFWFANLSPGFEGWTLKYSRRALLATGFYNYRLTMATKASEIRAELNCWKGRQLLDLALFDLLAGDFESARSNLLTAPFYAQLDAPTDDPYALLAGRVSREVAPRLADACKRYRAFLGVSLESTP